MCKENWLLLSVIHKCASAHRSSRCPLPVWDDPQHRHLSGLVPMQGHYTSPTSDPVLSRAPVYPTPFIGRTSVRPETSPSSSCCALPWRLPHATRPLTPLLRHPSYPHTPITVNHRTLSTGNTPGQKVALQSTRAWRSNSKLFTLQSVKRGSALQPSQILRSSTLNVPCNNHSTCCG